MANNLTSSSTRTDLNTETDKFFNNMYQPAFTISSAVNDLVIGYFEKITSSTEAAKLMASSVIYTSLAQRIDPREVLEKFKTMSDTELASYTSMFLNLNRVGSSYLGINNQPKTNNYVKRMIRP
jgi:hypothetical protein